MRTMPFAAPWFAVLAAALPAQARPAPFEPKAAVAELVAESTRPERRGELFARLGEVEFATFGKELARAFGKPRAVEYGVGWSTQEPWLETRIPVPMQVLGTLHRLWDRHLQHPLDEGEVAVLWQILEDPSSGVARRLAASVLLPMGQPEPSAITDGTLARLDRLARIDADPAFRATCIDQIGQHVAMDGYVDLVREVVRTTSDPVEGSHLLHCSGVLRHVSHLAPEARGRLVRFVIDLIDQVERRQPGSGQSLAFALFAGMGIRDSQAVPQGGAANVRGTAELRASLAAAEPFLPMGCELVQRAHGKAVVDCVSNWRSVRAHRLQAAGVLCLGTAELAPLLPKQWPLPAGTRWEVRGESLAGWAKALATLGWDDGAAGAVWGWESLEHVVQASGSLAVAVELRDGRLGLAIGGRLAVHETGRAGSRFGPNDLVGDATHDLTLWLPLDDENRVTGFELRDEVAVAGRYGEEKFTQTQSFTSAPGPLLSPAERQQAEKWIQAAVQGDEAAATQLSVSGGAVAPALVEAITRSSDFGVKRRLTAVLRGIRR